ncbi:adenylosuccinate synthetase, partial [Striga asiatica]
MATLIMSRCQLLFSSLLASIVVRSDLNHLRQDEVSSTVRLNLQGKVVKHLCVLTSFGWVNEQPYYEILNNWGEVTLKSDTVKMCSAMLDRIHDCKPSPIIEYL